MNVDKVMRKDVVALRPEEPIASAWRQMRDQRIDALPVTDPAGHLLGVLTERDLLARLTPRRTSCWWSIVLGTTDRLAADYVKAVGLTVGQVMTPVPVTVAPDASITEAAVLLRGSGRGVLPVVADDVCVGVVIRADVLDHLSWPAPAGPGTVEDAELEHSMREGIEKESWASRHPITVEALHGVIRLTGVVATPVERSALLAMGRSLDGCAGVEDRLIVRSRVSRYHQAPGIS
jgi:CBS domain-containing protein